MAALIGRVLGYTGAVLGFVLTVFAVLAAGIGVAWLLGFLVGWGVRGFGWVVAL